SLDLVVQELHGLDGVQLGQQLTENPDPVEHLPGQQELLLAGAGAGDVHGGEHATIHQASVEVDLHVPGALELLEDDLVHPAAGVDQGRAENGEAAALLDVARGAAELLRAAERVRVDAAGEDLAARRYHGIVGARQARDRVEQHDDVAPVLHQALRLLDDHLGDLHVTGGRLVEGRADDLAAHRPLHVGDLLGALVDEEHDEDDGGMVGGDAVGDVLEHHRLAGARRRDDEAALSLAHGGEEIDDPGRELLRLELEPELLLRIERRQVVEQDLLPRALRLLEVDGLDLEQREVALALLGRTDLPRDHVAGAQVEAADLTRGDVDVVGTRQVVVVGTAQEAEAVGQDLEDALPADCSVELGLRLENGEDQLLAPERRRPLDAHLLRQRRQVTDLLLLQLLEIERRDVRGGNARASLLGGRRLAVRGGRLSRGSGERLGL